MLKNDLKIRPYEAADLEEVLAVFDLNCPEYFHPDERKDLVEYLDVYAKNYRVALLDGKLRAAGGFNVIGKTGRISWDFTHPEARGNGLGSALVKHRLAYMQENYTLNKLEVRTSQFAKDYYARFGFKMLAYEKDYWAPGFDLYHMGMEVKKEKLKRYHS